VRVPRFAETLHRDTPLPESFAAPYSGSEEGLERNTIRVVERRYGQFLSGDMVPVREVKTHQQLGTAPKTKNHGAGDGAPGRKEPLATTLLARRRV